MTLESSVTSLVWPNNFLPSEIMPYQGQHYLIAVKHGLQHKICLQHQSVQITLPAHTPILHYPQLLQYTLLSWLKDQAFQAVQTLIIHYGRMMGKMPRRFGVKLTKSRWGSLGIHDDLNINWLLVLAPVFVLEYVVIHELGHLFYRSHGPRFWGVVQKWCPEYREAERWLRGESARQLLGWYGLIKQPHPKPAYKKLVRAQTLHVDALSTN